MLTSPSSYVIFPKKKVALLEDIPTAGRSVGMTHLNLWRIKGKQLSTLLYGLTETETPCR